VGETSTPSPSQRRWRLALTVLLAVYGWRILTTPGTYRWIDSLDLAIHEAGHLVFVFGGETLTVLGGTLFQLLVPAVFAGALWRQGDRHGATVPLWWLAQNCWNVSVYVRDARAQELQLVGGGEHDWAYLLSEAGWLARDQFIGRAIQLVGLVIYGVSIVGGWYYLREVSGGRTSPSPGGRKPGDDREAGVQPDQRQAS
jgi:hypothetical protein